MLNSDHQNTYPTQVGGWDLGDFRFVLPVLATCFIRQCLLKKNYIISIVEKKKKCKSKVSLTIWICTVAKQGLRSRVRTKMPDVAAIVHKCHKFLVSYSS